MRVLRVLGVLLAVAFTAEARRKAKGGKKTGNTTEAQRYRGGMRKAWDWLLRSWGWYRF